MGDLSSQSGDHGVTSIPAAAQRIEVVRGPATLLYGANAIGGLVNVITDEIPTRPVDGRHRQLHVRLRDRPPRKAAAPATCTSATARSRCKLGGGGRRAATSRRPRARSTTRSRAAGSATSGCRGPARRATSAAATATTTRSTAFRSSKAGRLQLDAAASTPSSLRGGAQGLDGAFDVVPRHARRAALQARRAGRRRGRHRVHEQHDRRRGPWRRTGRRPAEGQRRRVGARPRLRGGGRGGAVARRSTRAASRRSSTRS